MKLFRTSFLAVMGMFAFSLQAQAQNCAELYQRATALKNNKNYVDAIGYYQLHSLKAPALFIEEVGNTFKILAQNPFFAVKYKNVRAIKIKKFPYSLYFIVNKSKKTVRILACFHTKRNPEKLPRK